MNKPRVRKYGSNGILVEWEAIISPEINDQVVQTVDFLQEEYSEVILEVIPSYHSLLIFLKEGIDVQIYFAILRNSYMSTFSNSDSKNTRILHVPVSYNAEFGYDLETISQTSQLSVESIIHLHCKTSYRIYGMGFLPGFLYLGGLDERLHCPRKSEIKHFVPKGSVAIGGKQTGIYPQQSPGGWNVIGRTPIELFDATKEDPSPFSVGDSIQFTPVSLEEFHEIQFIVNKGKYELKFTSND